MLYYCVEPFVFKNFLHTPEGHCIQLIHPSELSAYSNGSSTLIVTDTCNIDISAWNKLIIIL